MEYFIYTISFLFAVILIVFPVFLIYRLKKQYLDFNLILYIILGIIISSFLFLLFAWWGYYSCEILLSHYGYNFEIIMSDAERIKNVSPENLNRVIFLNNKRMGIGWPLKAIFWEVIYFPYLLIVYALNFFYSKLKLKKKLQRNKQNKDTKKQLS